MAEVPKVPATPVTTAAPKVATPSPAYPLSPNWQQKFKDGTKMSDLTDKLGYSLYDLVEKTKTTQTKDQLLGMDYFVLAMFFVISVAIGVYLGWRAKKQNPNKDEQLTGGRTLSGIPVALSCTASFMSAITILGTPVEIYNYGTMYYYSALTYFCVACIVAGIFLPVLYDLNLANGYEYFRHRFNSVVIEKIASTGFLLTNLLYMGIVTYAPALALSAITSLNIWTAAAITAATCTVYTFIGGLKAVIWVDVFQALTIMTGFLSIIFVGSGNFGGIGNVIAINEAGGRIIFNDFRMSPTVRSSLWSVVIGGTFGVWGGIYTNQSMIQRYMACKNVFEAKKSVFLNVVGLWIIMVLAGLCGHVAYAYSQFCDPKGAFYFKEEKDQNRGDMLIPYLSVSVLKHIPGMAGLYAAAVYAGTLSSLSGGINSNAAVILKNYIKPCMKSAGKTLSAAQESKLSKILVLAIGCLTFCVSYIASLLGDSVLVAGLSALGTLCGPCMGLFLLGFLCPLADGISGLIAYVSGHVVSIFLFLGLVFDPAKNYEKSPLAKENCLCEKEASSIFTSQNVTSAEGVISTEYSFNSTEYPCLENRKILDFFNQDEPERSFLSKLWHVSYWHLGSSGCLTVFFVGWIVALIRTKLMNKKEHEDIQAKYLHPLVRGTKIPEEDYLAGQSMDEHKCEI